MVSCVFHLVMRALESAVRFSEGVGVWIHSVCGGAKRWWAVSFWW